MRDVVLTCAQKLTHVSLIYRTEPTSKKRKTEKKVKSTKNGYVHKRPGEPVESVHEEETEG